MDETTLQVLKELGKPAQSKSYMWVRASQCEHPVILYHYEPKRAQIVPLTLLRAYYRVIMVDGYEAYQSACDNYDITRLGCWRHARHRFSEIKKTFKKGKSGRVDQDLSFIRKLNVIEEKIKLKPSDERYEVRQREAKPVIEKLRQWLTKNLPYVVPGSAIGKAMHYLHNQWGRLIHYIEDGCYPIDNNYAENKIRPFTIGRKN